MGIIMSKIQLFELILSIKRKCQSREDIIKNDLGLSQAEFNGLLVLKTDEQIQGFQFADRMGLSPSRGSRVLGKLSKRGFVKTEFKPNDRRTMFISLTKKGARSKQDIYERMKACEDRICSQLQSSHLEQIRESLMMLDQVL
jgi:DNA-binding MarR family transcriptional regulator